MTIAQTCQSLLINWSSSTEEKADADDVSLSSSSVCVSFLWWYSMNLVIPSHGACLTAWTLTRRNWRLLSTHSLGWATFTCCSLTLLNVFYGRKILRLTCSILISVPPTQCLSLHPLGTIPYTTPLLHLLEMYAASCPISAQLWKMTDTLRWHESLVGFRILVDFDSLILL